MQEAGAVQVMTGGAIVVTRTGTSTGAGVVVTVTTGRVLAGWRAVPAAAVAAGMSSTRRRMRRTGSFMIDHSWQSI
jgi:hypothetical protein